MRKGAISGGVALIVALFASSGAHAQCTDNFNFAAVIPGVGLTPVQNLTPLGTGSSLSALTSTINTVNTAFLTTTSGFVSAPGNPQPDQQGGGAWARAIGGTVDSKATSVGTLDTSNVLFPTAPATGTQTCHTTTRQDYAGVQVGHDISILNGGGTGANWHFGVTTGYLQAQTKDITPAGSFTNPNFPAGVYSDFPFGGTFFTPAGSFEEDSKVPFVGIYSAYTKGGFFADAQARWDFFQNTLTDPNNGLFGQRLDARGFALTGNVGHNMRLASGWFIEPSAGLVWSRVKVDALNVPGVIVGAGFPIARGSVTVDDIENLLGRATVRVGTNFTSGGIAWQPFFTASVFHEFAGDVTATSVVSGTGNPFIENLALTTTSKGGVGTYGQFALGTAAQILNTGWLGYGRVDYRIGERIEGISVNAGLRYQFTPGQQARPSLKDGSGPALYSYNWTGPYIGTFFGATWGGQHTFAPAFGTSAEPDFAGYLVGTQVGYNFQHGRWVYGIEGDFGFSNAHGGVSCPSAFDFTCGAELEHLGSLTGRLGITWGRALFYAKGGWATGEVTASTRNNSGAPAVGETKWLSGWTVGAGMEFALTDRFSAKAEYMHYDLGSETFIVGGPTLIDVDTRGSIARIGVNYHLGR